MGLLVDKSTTGMGDAMVSQSLETGLAWADVGGSELLSAVADRSKRKPGATVGLSKS